MKGNKVPIPAEVMDGLEAVRASGKTNMLDIPMVVNLALDMGYPETAAWISANKHLYSKGIFTGFEVSDDLDKDVLRKMTERFLDSSGGDE